MTLLCPVLVSFTHAWHAMQRPCPACLWLAWPKSNEKLTPCLAFSCLPAALNPHRTFHWALTGCLPKKLDRMQPRRSLQSVALSPTLSDAVEVALEKREQKDCLVLSGIQDSGDDRKDFKSAMNILKQMKISSNPVRTFRMGSMGKKGQPRLLKVQLHSSYDCNQALRNSHKLANRVFSKVFVRPSLNAEERKRLKELTKECWNRNSSGDFCYIDWMSLSLKMSKKSPNQSEFVCLSTNCFA